MNGKLAFSYRGKGKRVHIADPSRASWVLSFCGIVLSFSDNDEKPRLALKSDPLCICQRCRAYSQKCEQVKS